MTEIERLRQWELVGREWIDKTDWMQSRDAPVRWLGKHRADALREEIERLTRERDEARAERDALAKDAARYRFLSCKGVPPHSHRWSRWRLEYWNGEWWDPLMKEELDAAIDAQIEQERSDEGSEMSDGEDFGYRSGGGFDWKATRLEATESHVRDLKAEIERLTAENEKLRRLLSEWLRENSPGGWIDELRRQLADAIRERDELRGLIDAHNADCIARCEAMSTQAGHAGVCSHYTNRGRTCPNCPRDEMIAQADAAMGLTRPAEE